MIQANELRIGNYIMYVEGEVGKVVGINDHGYIAISCDREYFGQSDYDPIPITPEILEKCGYRISFGLYCNGSHRMKTSSRGRFIFMPYGTSDINLHIPIDYLHEFQNLYHAITGTELNVQL